MACGTPVIALNEGGTKETIEEGTNGVHFEHQTKESIMDALERFETLQFNYKQISESADSYNEERFKSEIREFINEKK